MEPKFRPSTLCGVSVDLNSPYPFSGACVKDTPDLERGVPIVGSRDLHGEIVNKNTAKGAPFDGKPQAARVVARAVLQEAFSAVEETPVTSKVAAGGPPNCEARCKALEAENLALIGVIARLHAENSMLKAGA